MNVPSALYGCNIRAEMDLTPLYEVINFSTLNFRPNYLKTTFCGHSTNQYSHDAVSSFLIDATGSRDFGYRTKHQLWMIIRSLSSLWARDLAI